MNLFILVLKSSNVFLYTGIQFHGAFSLLKISSESHMKLEIEVKWRLNIFLYRKVFFHHLQDGISPGSEVIICNYVCNVTCSVKFDQCLH